MPIFIGVFFAHAPAGSQAKGNILERSFVSEKVVVLENKNRFFFEPLRPVLL